MKEEGVRWRDQINNIHKSFAIATRIKFEHIKRNIEGKNQRSRIKIAMDNSFGNFKCCLLFTERAIIERTHTHTNTLTLNPNPPM